MRTKSTSALTDDATQGCLSLPQRPPDSGFALTPSEAQEVFGRGILRIQPHGPRHAYFMTFLPYVVQPAPMPLTPEMPQANPLFNSREPALVELRIGRDLLWRDVAGNFKHQTPASLQAHYSNIQRGARDVS